MKIIKRSVLSEIDMLTKNLEDIRGGATMSKDVDSDIINDTNNNNNVGPCNFSSNTNSNFNGGVVYRF